MKNALLPLITSCLLAVGLPAADKPAAGAVTLTFFLGGVECPSCMYSVWQSLNEVKGIADAEMQQRIDSFANVTFDPAVISAHQIAHAVSGAFALHGRPYEAMLRLRVPDYARKGNAPRLDAVFARNKEWLEVETVDKAKGEFVLHFRPLKPAEAKKGPQGWSQAAFLAEVRSPAPKGLGLALEFEIGE